MADQAAIKTAAELVSQGRELMEKHSIPMPGEVPDGLTHLLLVPILVAMSRRIDDLETRLAEAEESI